MADFQKIMHEWKRMCAATSLCEVCPLKDEKCWATSPANMVGDSKSIEAIIMAWAADHPEPVYPRWVDWLVKVGVLGYETRQGHDSHFVEQAMFDPIPADIAEKLGIEPKEG